MDVALWRPPTRGPKQTMKNKGFHIQKPCFLLGKPRFFDGPCGAPGRVLFCL